MLDRDWIARHVPHQGSMCLLDRVLEWDAERIRCAAVSHRDPGNPLRAHGRLGAACGIEYAAQAMAVHGALCAAGDGSPAPAARGMLTSMRGVTIAVERLDDIAADLIVEARRSTVAPDAIAYDFTLTAGNACTGDVAAAVTADVAGDVAADVAYVAADARVLLSGRATITLQR